MTAYRKSALVIVSLSSLSILFALMGFSVFWPAGTFLYAEAWVLISVFALSCVVLTLFFVQKNPVLIARRTKVEMRPAQIAVQSLNGLSFMAILVLAGFAKRFSMWELPAGFFFIGLLLLLGGFYLVFQVFLQNTYLFSNISVEENQQLITTGLYAKMRHPMYTGAILILLAMPCILRAPLAFIPVTLLFAGIYVRAVDEETFLKAHLHGYTAYCQKVRVRFFPGLF